MTPVLRRYGKQLFGSDVRPSARLLRKLNIALSVVYLAQAAAVLLFSTSFQRPVHILYLTTDSLQSKLTQHVVSAVAIRQLFEINIAWLMTLGLAVTGMAHLACATIWRARYEQWLKKSINPVRWLALTIGAMCVFVSLALLVGMSDIASIVLACGFVGVAGARKLNAELVGSRNKQAQPFHRLLGLSCVVLPLVILALYVVATNVFGSARALSWCVYALTFSLLLLLAGLKTNGYLLKKKKWAWQTYSYGELWYSLLGGLLFSAIAWQLFGALLHP